jgi:hypothetical protein
MTNTIKITGIKKAVGDFNNWQGAARIYFDRSTGEVWTNIYTAPTWETIYHDPTIVQLASKATWVMTQRDNTITMAGLKILCEKEECCVA